MPTHAILINYRDMEEQIKELIDKAARKYYSFQQFYFDSVFLDVLLRHAVRDTPADHKLKIFISGHGGTGQQYITANDRVRKQTVEDLAGLLCFALRSQRATSRANSENTEVNMVSCLFGRISSAGLAECPAVLLHRELCSWQVYVDLVARTEYVAARATGRVTMSLRHGKIDKLKYDKLFQETSKLDPNDYVDDYHRRKNLAEMQQMVKSWQRHQAQFTKIRCTYRNDAAVVLIRDYKKEADDIHINSESREGRRILWADNVINELVKYITPPSGQTEVTDARHKTLYQTLEWYDTARDPEGLKAKMEVLISGAGGDDPAKKFLKDRGIGKLIPFRLPKTALLIQELLRAYPLT
jgi:hypothetical protein